MLERRAGWLWFTGALALYGVTAARGPMWADSSKLVLYATSGYIPSLNPGDHAGWTLVARCWLPLTSWVAPTTALTLLSATAAATAVGLLFGIVRRWTGGSDAAHAAAAVLAAAQGFWWTATVTESYPVAVALALAAVALEGRESAAAAVARGAFAGLAAATHLFTLALTLPVLLTVRHRALTGVGLALGLAPWWLGALWSPPDPLTGHSAGGARALGWHLTAFLAPAKVLRGSATLLGLLALNLGPLGGAAVARDVIRRSGPGHPAPLTGIVGALVLGLVLTAYSPYRLHVMVQVLVVAVLLLAPPRLSASGRVAHVLLQASLYLALPVAAQALGQADLGVRQLPLRSNAAYFLCPVKTWDLGPVLYARGVLAAAPAGATVLADFNPGAVLALEMTTAGCRPDLELVPTAVDEALAEPDPAAAIDRALRRAVAAGRPVVLADGWEPYYRLRELRARFGWHVTRCGPGWEARPASPP